MLKASRITKSFNRQPVISGLDFQVEPGENITIMAPSGYGKTTLMAILSGIDLDFSGTVTTRALQKGIVFQEPGLFWYKTVKENIVYPLEIRKIPWCKNKQQHYQDWMAVTGLAGFEHHYPHEISRGMKQKTAIIRTFLNNPDLVFMDEPFSNIDAASAHLVIDHIHTRYPDMTLVVASHSPGEATRFSNRVLTAAQTPISGFEILIQAQHAVLVSGDANLSQDKNQGLKNWRENNLEFLTKF